MKVIAWDKLSLRDRIAARIYCSFLTTTQGIQFLPNEWASASKENRAKSRSVADGIRRELSKLWPYLEHKGDCGWVDWHSECTCGLSKLLGESK